MPKGTEPKVPPFVSNSNFNPEAVLFNQLLLLVPGTTPTAVPEKVTDIAFIIATGATLVN